MAVLVANNAPYEFSGPFPYTIRLWSYITWIVGIAIIILSAYNNGFVHRKFIGSGMLVSDYLMLCTFLVMYKTQSTAPSIITIIFMIVVSIFFAVILYAACYMFFKTSKIIVTDKGKLVEEM